MICSGDNYCSSYSSSSIYCSPPSISMPSFSSCSSSWTCFYCWRILIWSLRRSKFSCSIIWASCSLGNGNCSGCLSYSSYRYYKSICFSLGSNSLRSIIMSSSPFCSSSSWSPTLTSAPYSPCLSSWISSFCSGASSASYSPSSLWSTMFC